jgi:predicted transcriptional regulator
LKKKLNFFQKNTFPKRVVGVTCETCAVKNCTERVAAPLKLEKQEKYTQIANTVAHIMNSYD